jgi:23S rRNA (uracil1939-C5)-methyltransferase
MICPHFGVCGGCQTQDVPYGEQLARKERRLEDVFRKVFGDRAPTVQPMIGMPAGSDGMPWHFRHKAAFVFAHAPGGLALGHYAPGSKTIVPVEDCPVHGERANRLAFALRDQLARAGITAAGPRLQGLARHTLVRTSRDEREAMVVLVVTRNDRALRAPLRAFLASVDRPDGLFVNVNRKPGPYLIGEETIRIAGRSRIREDVLGTAFLVSPAAFFQTNPAAAAALLGEVLTRAASHGDSTRTGLDVLDLYAGGGLFALPLAARGHRVTAVEENAMAIDDASASLRLNRIPAERLRLVRARVEDALGRLHRRPDLVVLDPPREGCPASVIRRVFAEIAPPRAIHVSCNPDALARELAAIAGAGYRIDRVQPVDMFPHTDHIETVVTLSRQGLSPFRSDPAKRGLSPLRPDAFNPAPRPPRSVRR